MTRECKISVDVIDYLGNFEDGIFVLISLGYEEEFYDATFYYKEELVALTPDDELEEKLGCQIEDWEEYAILMFNIIDKVIPYKKALNIVGDFDPAKYNLYKDETTNELED